MLALLLLSLFLVSLPVLSSSEVKNALIHYKPRLNRIPTPPTPTNSPTPSGSLLVSTLDGSLSSFDLLTGKFEWSLDMPGGNLLASNHNKLKLIKQKDPLHDIADNLNEMFEPELEPEPETLNNENNHNNINAGPGTGPIPAVDGSLWFLNPQYQKDPSRDNNNNMLLYRLPISISELVNKSPFTNNDNTRFIGDKKTSVFLINRKTGKIHKTFNLNNDNMPFIHNELYQCQNDPDYKDLIWIGKTKHFLQALDGRTFTQTWNVSLSTYSSFYGSDKELSAAQLEKISMPSIGASINGELFVLDMSYHSERLLWKYKLHSPISAVHFIPGTPAPVPVDTAAASAPPPNTPNNENPNSNGNGNSGDFGLDMFKLPLFYFDPDTIKSDDDSTSEPIDLNTGQLIDKAAQTAIDTYYREGNLVTDKSGPSQSLYVQRTKDGSFYILPNSKNLYPKRDPSSVTIPVPHKQQKEPSTSLTVATPECYPDSEDYPNCLTGIHIVPDIPIRSPNSPEIGWSFPPMPQLPAPERTQNRDDFSSLVLLAIGMSITTFIVMIFGFIFMYRKGLGNKKKKKNQNKKSKQKEKNLSVNENNNELDANGNEASGNLKSKQLIEPDTPSDSSQKSNTTSIIVSPATSNPSEGSGLNNSAFSPSPSPSPGKIRGPDGEYVIGKMLVTTEVLGTGSMGTVVFGGSFEGRPVAIKRMIKPFYGSSMAEKEIDLLIQSDQHPHVLRYYAKEEDADFIYLALERCAASLNDVVTGKHDVDKLTVLHGMVNGLAHLHGLSIVHRDLKPANILLSHQKKGKIADMGLGKKLELNRSSFDSVVSGSVGWQPPEVLNNNGRLTKAVDIFSAGCVLHYVLSDGQHPYGSLVEREHNIVRGIVNLSAFDNYPEARDLISSMIHPDPNARISANDAVAHPLFWSDETRLAFLGDCSDRVESEAEYTELRLTFESHAEAVVGKAWNESLHQELLENLGKYRKYDFSSVRDCLRVIRNKKNHYRELPLHVQQMLGSVPSGFLNYFHKRFPQLLMYTYHVMACFIVESCPIPYVKSTENPLPLPLPETTDCSISFDKSKLTNLSDEYGNAFGLPLHTTLRNIQGMVLSPAFSQFYCDISLKRLLQLQAVSRIHYRTSFSTESDWIQAKEHHAKI